MKVVWGKFGTGVDLIVCAISSYWWVSLWVNEKDAFHAYSLKTSIIVFLGIMFFLKHSSLWNCDISTKTNLYL